MTGPPDQGQPWWQRPGGAPSPGRPPYPPPQGPSYPPPQQRPQYPPPQRPHYQPPPQQPGWQPGPPQQPPWPQQQYHQQPAQQPPPAYLPPKSQPSRGPMIAGVIVAVAVIGGLALVAGLWLTGSFGSGTVLDVGKAEAGVKLILSDPINGYGANQVSSVKCNNGENPTVKQGEGFSCDVTINGSKRKVQVIFRDDAGTYEVDGPR
jgi:uncharacterized protein DUF4333